MVNSNSLTNFHSAHSTVRAAQTPSTSRGKRLRNRRSEGFGLIELMIGLILVATLLGIGLPMFRDFIVDQRLRATSSDLRVAVMTARSEAVKRNRVVELKPKAGGWGEGWTIPSPNGGDPDILSNKPSGDVTITSTGGLDARFTPTGRAMAPVEFQIGVGPEATSDPETTSESVACLQLQLDGRMVSNKGACPNG